MPLKTPISFPAFGLASKGLGKSVLKKSRTESNGKNMINKEMIIDIVELVLLTIAPILIALIN
jgi:hypothetical protein